MTTKDLLTAIDEAADASGRSWEAAVDSAESEGDAERAANARAAEEECMAAYDEAFLAARDAKRYLEDARSLEAAWGDDSCARGVLRLIAVERRDVEVAS